MKLIFILIFLTKMSFAQTQSFKINFIATTNVPGMDIRGEVEEGITNKVTIKENTLSSILVSFDSKLLTTGLDLRDEHLHKFLKNSQLEFKSTSGCEFVDSTCEISGTLKIALKNHDTKLVIKKEQSKLVSTLKVALSDFDLDRPSFAGVTVDDEVLIKIESEVK